MLLPILFIPLYLPSAAAMTLEEAVQRAATLDPAAVIAASNERIAALAATEAWAGLGLTPSLSYNRRLQAGVWTGGISWQVSLGAVAPATWFNAMQQGAQRDSVIAQAGAATFDAQYAAALLYYDAIAAQSYLDAAHAALTSATGIAEVTQARLKAGLESDLAARAAELERLRAQAAVAQAESSLRIARARLQRALQTDPGELTAPPLPAFPGDERRSPWLDSAAAEVRAARYGQQERVAAIFPSGSLSVSSGNFSSSTAGAAPGVWSLNVGLSWTLDGIVNPFLRAREADLERRIAEVSYENLKLDLDLGLTEARAQADAARTQVDAARAREALATESLAIGQARQQAGLSNALELLRLQDDLLLARADRVQAEHTEALAILSARRLAGLGW